MGAPWAHWSVHDNVFAGMAAFLKRTIRDVRQKVHEKLAAGEILAGKHGDAGEALAGRAAGGGRAGRTDGSHWASRPQEGLPVLVGGQALTAGRPTSMQEGAEA
jgi:hypothetical protein